MNRRQFLELGTIGLSQSLYLPRWAAAFEAEAAEILPGSTDARAFGSGHFGEWITDEFGLPAYRYTCSQDSDPAAVSPVHQQWRFAADHTHQVGNDRLIAAVSNYGFVQVRQDEGSPKFLNDYAPGHGRYGAGIGFLTDGKTVLSTFYPGHGESFERTFGEGYYRKTVKGSGYEVDQAIIAPFGDDPVLISRVKVTNRSGERARLRWVEYWGCMNFQFSFRSNMESVFGGMGKDAATARRDFGARFEHEFRRTADGHGLIETQKFMGWTTESIEAWNKANAALAKDPTTPFGPPLPELAPETQIDDLKPPPTLLFSLDGPIDSFATDGSGFFGSGGIERPSGLSSVLNNDLGRKGAEGALLVERDIELDPGESRTIHFLYGYLPGGFDLDGLVNKYRADVGGLWTRSSAQWKTEGIRLRVPSAPWVERETSWHSYYVRSNLTFDSFFGEHILSEGSVYQYIMGSQLAARDPLQHALPFVFGNASTVKEIVRYTLKEIQPDGSIPYAIIGSGVPAPTVRRPSDLEMWLLWAASEYVLATRDQSFLTERIPPYPRRTAQPGDPTVKELLWKSYLHCTGTIGVGEHGLMRLSDGDWNDNVVEGHVPPEQTAEVRAHGESVLNAAMAAYVFAYYGEMLKSIGDLQAAADARAKAEAQRQAVGAQWTGSWFRRAWLSKQLGWVGEDHLWLEPQPWAIVGGSVTPEQRKRLTESVDELVRKPSPIGALIESKGDDTMSAPAGTMENGGVWPAINGTLVWALALENGEMAWDEWKKNSLAYHAEAYPNIWYGIWSGPDYYDSVLSRYPGQTMFAEAPSKDHKVQMDWGFNWTDFPVMNMHPHAWPLYSTAKLLGLAFTEAGLTLEPKLPMNEYEFSSQLLGFYRSKIGYSGWYQPAVAGTWKVAVTLSSSERMRMRQIKVNDSVQHLPSNTGVIVFQGQSEHGKPLRWELS
jgi:Glycosyl hydrolase 36 superfamily, catalytic domain/Glycosyltransferase family 36